MCIQNPTIYRGVLYFLSEGAYTKGTWKRQYPISAMNPRKIEKIYPAKPTREGAGVHLMRGFGYFELPVFDPFLMFDDFSNTEEVKYHAGFPEHPHRGMETVTYILKGEVQHRDSLGNEGSIRAGDVQWMTAGSGIVHEEMPRAHKDGIQGFQLWVNLPQEHKMMAPRYQEIKNTEIPVVREDDTEIRVVAGVYKDAEGPVKDLVVTPTYLDVTLEPNTAFTFPTPEGQTFFVYVFEGRIMQRDDRSEHWIGEHDVALLTDGESFSCTTMKTAARFLLIGGKPIEEPIAWSGPIVMNTDEEVAAALSEYRSGSFVRDT